MHSIDAVHSAIFKAIALTAEHLLKDTGLDHSIGVLLARLGQATEADRVYVFENQLDTVGTRLTKLRYKWLSTETPPPQDSTGLWNALPLDIGLRRWAKTLASNQVFHGNTKDLVVNERKMLMEQDIQSILLAPIFVREKWWGFIGFDNYRSERAWSPTEIDAFKAAANIIGAALENTRLHQETQDRTRQLEALHDISRTIGSTLDQGRILNLTLERVCQLLHAPGSVAYLADLFADVAHRHTTAGPLVPEETSTPPLPLKSSLTGQVIITGRPIFIEKNLPTESIPHREKRYSPIQSELPAAVIDGEKNSTFARAAAFIPIAIGEHVLGTINIAFDKPRSFSAGEKKLVTAIGRQAGIALANARLFQEIVTAEQQTRRRAEQLAALHEIDQAISSSLEPAEVYSCIVKRAADLLDCHLSNLFLCDSTSSEIVSVACFGPSVHNNVGQRFDIDASPIAKEMLDTQSPVAIADGQRDPRVSPDLRDGYQAHAVLALPLISREQTTGFLYLIDQAGPRQWRPDEITIAGQLAALAAIAIENARLFEIEQKSRQTAEALQKTAQIVNSSLDLDQALNLLLEQLVRLVPYDSAAVFLHEDQMLHAAVTRGFADTEAVMRLTIHTADSPLLQQTIATGQPLLLSNAQLNEPFYALGGNNHIRGWIGVPLLVGTELVGILTIASHQPEAFDDETASLAQALADQTAVAINKARLLADLQNINLELRQLDELKDQFIQNVGHELRTPLTLVRGYVELLAQGNLDLVTQHEAIYTALSHTETLVRLVEGITTLQDLSLGELVLQPVNPTDLIKTALRLAAQKAVRANIRLVSDCPPDLPHLSGDFIWLSQAVYQVLDNAIKFSPDGGHVTLQISVDPVESDFLIEVEDQGIGVPPAEHERIFQLFYQADGSTTRRFGGTGLGLAIVQRVVQAHRGQVWVESPIQQIDSGQECGSKFFIRLPQNQEQGPDLGA